MSRRLPFAILFLTLLAPVWALVQPLNAQAGDPARRQLVVVEGVDYFGRDLETRQDIDLEVCQAACLADERCKAFTYNRKARWCFLKSDYEDARPFPNAISGHITAGVRDDQEPRTRRLAELGFLPRGYAEEARRQAVEIAARPRPVSARFDRLLAEAE
ncbi:MAG: PAN/Apple domain-containing protein, partial [Chromatiaceae bacterium]